MKEVKKLVLIVITLIAVFGFNKVYADFEFFKEYMKRDDMGFLPQEVDGEDGLFTCMHTFTESEVDMSDGFSPGETRGEYRSCSSRSAPWSGDKQSSIYRDKGQLNMQLHQDAAYIFSHATEGLIDLLQMRWTIWRLPINMGSPAAANEKWLPLENEAKAYKKFYDYIHNTVNDKTGYGATADRFIQLIKDNGNYNTIHNMVNRNEDYYIVGPFNFYWPDGRAPDGINKFSWLSNLTILDQNKNGIADMKSGTLQIIDKNGNLIYDTDKDGNKLNVPKINEDFYVKFHSTDISEMQVKIDFGYLESCPTVAHRYDGKFQNWRWIKEYTGDYHERTNSDGDVTHSCRYYEYVLYKKEAGYAQTLLNLRDSGKVYESNKSITLPYKKDTTTIDLTMEIEGTVFLDQDRGKVNAGNNKYDSGEGLEGIDVWLYEKDGTLVDLTLTNRNGHYSFTELNAQKEYYVKFVYNGMLYTNVDYVSSGAYYSKATEVAHSHSSNRTNFNNKFAEVSSYPQNYKTKDCLTGANITNKVYEQGDLVTLYKDVAKAMVAKGRK